LVLDFKNPEKSMRYNLLQPIIDAISEGDTDRAEMLAWDLTNNLVGKPEGEKIWTNGECSILTESEKLGFRLNGKRCRKEQSEHAKFHDSSTIRE
jgi:hypothetical protein